MKTEYENIVTEDGVEATSFNIKTRKGQAHGLHIDKIYIHGIFGKGSVKGILNILVAKFKTNKVVFTPLVNNNVENSIRGEIKYLPPEHPENPYGETLKYMECEWQKT